MYLFSSISMETGSMPHPPSGLAARSFVYPLSQSERLRR
jgi:hypothetical protein